MVIYYCDGSMADGIIGVGIVRFIPENGQKETYSYRIKCNSNKRDHEKMAIKKVLELALKNESFLKVFLEFIHSGTILEKERLEAANIVKNLLTSSTVHLYKMLA